MQKYYVYPAMFGFIILLTTVFDSLFLPFILVFCAPFFLDTIEESKGYESIWIYPIVFVLGFFPNAYLTLAIVGQLNAYGKFATFLIFLIIFIFFISLEELVTGFITRRLYRNQNRIEF